MQLLMLNNNKYVYRCAEGNVVGMRYGWGVTPPPMNGQNRI